MRIEDNDVHAAIVPWQTAAVSAVRVLGVCLLVTEWWRRWRAAVFSDLYRLGGRQPVQLGAHIGHAACNDHAACAGLAQNLGGLCGRQDMVGRRRRRLDGKRPVAAWRTLLHGRAGRALVGCCGAMLWRGHGLPGRLQQRGLAQPVGQGLEGGGQKGQGNSHVKTPMVGGWT